MLNQLKLSAASGFPIKVKREFVLFVIPGPWLLGINLVTADSVSGSAASMFWHHGALQKYADSPDKFLLFGSFLFFLF
jgi:hypothetical protein